VDIQEVLGLLPVLSLVGLQAKVLLGKGLFSKVLKLSVCGPLSGPLSQILRESVRLVWYCSKTRSQQPYRHGSGEFSPVISLSGSKAVISIIFVILVVI